MALVDVRIGVCKLYLNAAPGQQGSLDLGNTLDGIEVAIDRKFTDLNVDAYGDTPIDKVLTSMGFTVKTKLAEPTAINLQNAIPEAAKNNGTLNTPRTGIGRTAGYLLKQAAFTLILRPIQNVAAGTDKDDIVIYSAVSSEPITLPYKVKDQRVIEVTFTALVNEAYEDGRRLGHIGPQTIS